jgi:VIT1/CCC1 family predicted Fe2+/Mn2+ transporter
VAGYPAAGYDGDFGPGGLGATDFSSDFSTADFSTAEFTADDFAAGDLAESGLAAADYAPGAYPPVRRAPREYPPRDRASREGGARDGGPLDSAPRGRGPRGRGPRPERGQAPRRPDTDQEARRRQPQGTSLLSGYVPATGAAYEPGESDTPRRPSASAYKPFPEWLPFGHRLALLPKELADDPDEEPREHRDVSGGWLRPAVFGAMDGLVTNSSLIAGVGGGGGGHGAIILTGIAGLIAGAFSMATGEYISVTSQNELTQAEVELERMQHRQDRAGKLGRLTEIYMDKGVSPNLAEAVARQISADEDRAVATHVREELGIDPEDMPSPRTAAAASFAAFTVGALLPLSPFLLGVPNLKLALVIAAVAAIVGGAAVA